MTSIKQINDMFDNSAKTITESKILSDKILDIVNTITKCLKSGNKVILFGNGGSAADAQHMAAEFIGRYLLERKSFPAIALTTDSSILTAIGNDYGFDKVFARQCEALAEKGDVIVAISTSGNSTNVIKGIESAKMKGGVIISLTGKSGGKLAKISDFLLNIPSEETPRIQEGQRVVIHIICELVEKNLSSKVS